MTTRPRPIFAALTWLGLAAGAALAADGPPPVAATRPELKRSLEDSKHNQPRLPLPPLTAEEREKAARGDWSVVNNGRMRRFYLPPELAGGGLTREPEPAMSLGYPFQTMLFWIVSRANNCTYCMGHQESKLAAAGLPEGRIAALDGDWSEFSDAERAAMALARKLTLRPDTVEAADIEGLRRYDTDLQVLEILLSTASFNAMNRWTGALKIPQEEHRNYLTETEPKYRDGASRVAPLAADRSASAMACAAPSRRPPLESAEAVAQALDACRGRTPLIPLASEVKGRALLSADASASATTPGWVRLLAHFPKAGGARVALRLAAEDKGTLDRKLRAEIAYTAARLDRAWYALGHARRRLLGFGMTEAQIAALDGPLDAQPAGERAALSLARKLTTDPALIDDADVAALRPHFADKQVAEVIHQVAEAAFFDRITEAARLRLED